MSIRATGQANHRFKIAIFLCIIAGAFVSSALTLDRNAIEKALAHPNLKGAAISVEIYSITAEKTRFARGARNPLILASNNKLITTASALYHLGSDYELTTRVYAFGRIENGTLDGDLVVRGGGDPALAERFFPGNPLAPLEELAHDVKNAGITRITGAILLDDTVFDRQFVAPGWPADQLNLHYCAPVSGLSILENLVQVEVMPADRPGRAASQRLIPGDAPFRLDGEISTTSKKGENIIHISRPEPDGVLKVRGRTYSGNKLSVYSTTVGDPVGYFGALFQAALEQAGIQAEEGIRLLDQAHDYDAEICQLLASVTTDILPVITIINKESHNLFAEHLFKLSGWKVTGQGRFDTGEHAAKMLFQDLNITDIDPFAMCDGSGLSRENRFSAHTVVSLLAAVYKSRFRDDYIRSLPVSGMDGSLEHRLVEEPYRSRVRGKTGWIREVSALSGYAQSQSGEVYAFSILFNKYKGMNATMKSVQDAICRIIVDG